MNRLARMVVATLALLCLFTIGAGAAIARLLPPRLALFDLPRIAGASRAVAVRIPAGVTGQVRAGRTAGPATAAGVSAALAPLIGSGDLGSRVGALVTDLSTGKVLYSVNADTGLTPASTTKIATAVAALQTLGPAARFSTSVLLGAASGTSASGGIQSIVLAGGGDPTLAAGPFPAADYPQPATLSSLAAATARALRARGIGAVRLTYDGSRFSGPELAVGWPAFGTPDNYVSTGNVAPIVGLEVDQGRLTSRGRPEDSDDPGNFLPRSLTPGLDAARAFEAFLRKDGITVRRPPAPARPHRRTSAHGVILATVQSPPLPQIIQQMLAESNNVIAETLARQVAIATGRPATFSGAASAVMAVDARLGVTGIALYDGSGLSQYDLISPHALVRLVRLAAADRLPGLRAVITGFPVAGFSGTLGPGSVFGPFGRAALGTVRAKTGNLTAVATMAGIAYARDGELLAFAFMGNDISKKLGLRPEYMLSQLASVLAGCGCR
ncbi:MAG TPA: D-alanyl-D-alanine carboxypeptidase/D-alanyl-D-alanine-endopeptidase [Streptosporangiaceae bacterium]|nr:D-alanyl-D-alanine carboxypeptidase/D-alanyl-D-alanine-endopeptidase [Streptosporangiaceae bacterium]